MKIITIFILPPVHFISLLILLSYKELCCCIVLEVLDQQFLLQLFTTSFNARGSVCTCMCGYEMKLNILCHHWYRIDPSLQRFGTGSCLGQHAMLSKCLLYIVQMYNNIIFNNILVSLMTQYASKFIIMSINSCQSTYKQSLVILIFNQLLVCTSIWLKEKTTYFV